jgi:nucleoside-diphosphate-sugar epimerase
MKQILIIGGGGYIGRHTALYLLDQGYTPTILDNFTNSDIDQSRELMGMGAELIINNAAVINPEDWDGVIHLACNKSIGQGEKEPTKYMENIQDLISFLEKLPQRTPLVYASSAAVYGTTANTIAPTNIYGMVKAISEKIVLEQHPRSKIFRYFNVIGSDPKGRLKADPKKVESFVDRLYLQENLKIRRRWNKEQHKFEYPQRDFISVWDVARANTEALKDCDGSIHNLSTGIPTSIKTLAEVVLGNTWETEELPEEEVLFSRGNPDQKYKARETLYNIMESCRKYYG